MFARVARYDVEPDRTDEAIAAFRDAVDELESAEGLTGGYVLADREAGVIMSFTLWTNRTAMDSSEVKAAGLRQRAAKAVDGEVVSVHCLDVAIDIEAHAPSGAPAVP
jgi:heme-degrading monooxygenase HmoA